MALGAVHRSLHAETRKLAQSGGGPSSVRDDANALPKSHELIHRDVREFLSQSEKANTKGVWVYDMRANMEAFGKTRILAVDDFKPFEKAFGVDPHGKAKRKDEGPEGRFRFFTREQIAARNDNLDIAWLRDISNDPEDEMTKPDELAAAIVGHLKNALEEIEILSEELMAPTEKLVL